MLFYFRQLLEYVAMTVSCTLIINVNANRMFYIKAIKRFCFENFKTVLKEKGYDNVPKEPQKGTLL